MATKDCFLSFKDKQQTFSDNFASNNDNSCFTNLNLNQSQESSKPLLSNNSISNYNKTNNFGVSESRRVIKMSVKKKEVSLRHYSFKKYKQNYKKVLCHLLLNEANKIVLKTKIAVSTKLTDISCENDYYHKQTKIDIKNCSKNGLSEAQLFLTNINEKDEENQKHGSKKADVTPSSNTYSSTLSLHIAAYENSVEGVQQTSIEQEDCSNVKQDKSTSGKMWKSVKQIFSKPTTEIQNCFEFPRQGKEDAKTIKPEVMQFKASQKLFNPNETKPSASKMVLRERRSKTVAPNLEASAPISRRTRTVKVNKPAAPPRDRPSMVGLPPTATRKEVAAIKSPGRRGRKPKTPKQGESESEMDLTESSPATPSQNTAATDSVQEEADGNPTPAKKRRGRPPEETSVRAKKEKEKMRREKDKDRRERKKKEPKTEASNPSDAAENEEEETTEQDQEMEVTEDAASETEEDRAKECTVAAEVEKNEMPEVYLRGYSSFQLFCDYLLRKLMVKDPEEFFVYPVSSHVAPDYHNIITSPMNFYTIRRKISANEYTKLEELKADAILICENAMLYNNPHTVYYIAAQKLSALTKYYFSEDYLEYLRYTLPFGKDLERSILGLPEKDLPQRTQRVPTEPRPLFQKQQMESITAKKLLADAPAALKKKLTTEVPKWPLGYIDNHEGAVALNLVTSTEAAKIPLGDLIGKIEAGHTGLLTNFEDAFPALTPSSYLNYEPFASFAPMYDTTWATMNQRDSELLTQTYGDRENAADIFQLRQMVVDSGGFFLDLFDNMLNSLTDGEHSRTLETLKTNEKETIEALEKSAERPLTPSSFSKILNDIATLENIGVDTSFVEEIKAEYGLSNNTMAPDPEEEIERNAYMIQDLQYLQNQRLTRTVTNLSDVPQISEAELQLSSRMATNFQQQIIEYNVCPSEIVTPQAIHNAIGVNDDDGCDYDILREFMDF